jgi:RNA polymerase sigma-70 factor, ECF subfamily
MFTMTTLGVGGPESGLRDGARGLGRASGMGGASADWVALYREYRPLVHARCRQLLATRAAAEDATQEIFAKLMARTATPPTGDGRLPWLLRVATNHCLNELRGEKRRDLLRRMVQDGSTLGDDVVHRDLVWRLLGRMPEKLREVACLRHVWDLELDEIAQKLRVSRRTVVARLNAFNERGRRLLRSHAVADSSLQSVRAGIGSSRDERAAQRRLRASYARESVT